MGIQFVNTSVMSFYQCTNPIGGYSNYFDYPHDASESNCYSDDASGNAISEDDFKENGFGDEDFPDHFSFTAPSFSKRKMNREKGKKLVVHQNSSGFSV